MRHRRIVAAAALAVLAGSAAAAGARSWQVSATPNAGTGDGLSGVSALSARDVWAVGRTPGGSSNRPLVEHFDGSSWSVVPSPDPGPFSFLEGVSAASSGDVWAVGSAQLGVAQAARTLVEHWNGSAWSIVPSVDPKPVSTLSGVLALSPTDVWAVGNASKKLNGAHGGPLVEHYDGHAWSNVKVPKVNGSLRAITRAPSGLWAVGEDGVVLHQDASGWHSVPTPAPAGARTWVLSAVTTTPAGDLWAVGAGVRPQSGGSFTLVEHYDGTSWSIVTSPSPSAFRSSLMGVAALSATDLWAVGVADDPGDRHPLLLHWDGTSWNQAQGGPSTPAGSELTAVGQAGARQLWAVGDSFAGAAGSATLAERYR